MNVGRVRRALELELRGVLSGEELDRAVKRVVKVLQVAEREDNSSEGWRFDYLKYKDVIRAEMERFIDDGRSMSWFKYAYPGVDVMRTAFCVMNYCLMTNERWNMYKMRSLVVWPDVIRYSFTMPQYQVRRRDYIGKMDVIEMFKRRCRLTTGCTRLCSSRECSFLRDFGGEVWNG